MLLCWGWVLVIAAKDISRRCADPPLAGCTVVRFNGGAQAGHNVVTPAHRNSLSRHHTFHSLGRGLFVPRVRTLLVDR